MKRKLLVAGNWKMHGSLKFVDGMMQELNDMLPAQRNYDVAVFPVYIHLHQVINNKPAQVLCGAQNLSEHDDGAVTGEVSAAMLSDLGCDMVLVGHSERRVMNNESNAEVAKKFAQALKYGIQPILCVGESSVERQSNQTFDVVWAQIKAVIDEVGVEKLGQGVIAYEPVWAIGTGETATAEQAQEVHQFIRSQLALNDDTIARRIRILYGGSCKGSNAHELFSMPDVDGGLIGGAALTAQDFMAICQQADILSQGV
ncbi:triose-phosphate isomerase [Marinicella sp. S1101]|uniref:triose-phosphate isomerase n=1 Tax=Marinicella marina TaxID=2996016 RepID=UPI002260EADD|nr:triose-phosphate isomerase [Marinicella marina]MCX7554109.1 triose-phosphate isomerase [Marinicella marina]MDJ1141198.1 triose-phosphate isomerase [Marinicella marina]